MGRVYTEASKESKRRWDGTTRQFVFRLRRDKDADVIERLEGAEHKTDYLRSLVRSDIEGAR